MNAKHIKSRLNDELSHVTPDVLDDVRRASDINTTPLETDTLGKNTKRGLLKLAPTILSVCLIIAVVLGVVALTVPPKSPVPNIVNNAGYFSVDINPSVQVFVNNDNAVNAVKAANEDGEILLENIDEGLIGQTPDDAIQLILQSALELGYIDVNATAEEPNAIKIVSYTDDTIASANENKRRYKDLITSQTGSGSLIFREKYDVFAVFVTETLERSALLEIAQECDKNLASDAAANTLIAAIANSKEYYKQQIERFSEGENAVAVSSLYKIEQLYDFVEKLDKQKAAIEKLYTANAALTAKYTTNGFILLYESNVTDAEKLSDIARFKADYDKCVALLNCGSLNSLTFNLAYTAYASVNIAELKTTLGQLNTRLAAAKEAISAITAAINAYADALTFYKEWSDELSFLFENVPETVEEYSAYLKTRVEKKAADKKEEYAALVSAERAEITSVQRQESRNFIIETHGSVEEYFEYKKSKSFR